MDYKRATEIKSVYFREVLTSTWKSGNVLHWGRGGPFVSTENEKLWIPSNLITSDLTRGDLLRILAADMREEARKACRTGGVYADPSAWEQL